MSVWLLYNSNPNYASFLKLYNDTFVCRTASLEDRPVTKYSYVFLYVIKMTVNKKAFNRTLIEMLTDTLTILFLSWAQQPVGGWLDIVPCPPNKGQLFDFSPLCVFK